MLRWFARGRSALAIVGVEPGDGASIFASNLAVVFSQLGEQTLLVDANLRSPHQHEVFALKPRHGLSDVLAGRADLDVIARVPAFVDLSVHAGRDLAAESAGAAQPRRPSATSTPSSRAATTSCCTTCRRSPAASTRWRWPGAPAACCWWRARTTRGWPRVAHMAEQLAEAGADVVGSVVVDF